MIKIENVTKEYQANVKAVDNISLEIKSGEIFGFLGPNGAGKTTTLKMITGISSITEGNITIDGFDIYKDSYEAKSRIGFVPDNPDMLIRLKGIEYLHFIAKMYNIDPKVEQEKIKELAIKFNIQDALNEKIQTYSHGMRQKIVLISTLLHEPTNLILDEPLTGLDPKASFELKETMKEYASKGNTVLFSTHVLEVAEKLCDRVGIISKGKLLFVGTLNELKKFKKEDKSLEDFFLEMTDNK